MAKRPKTTALSKAAVLVSMVALVLYAIGVLHSHWLKAKFVVPAVPDVSPQEVFVENHLGPLKGCVLHQVNTTRGMVVLADFCSSKGDQEMLKRGSITVVIGGIISFIGLIVVVANIKVSRMAGRTVTKVVIAACSCASASFITAGLILWGCNRTLPAPPPVMKVKFDLDWSYFVTIVCASVYAALTVLMAADISRTFKADVEFLRLKGEKESSPLNRT